MGGGQRWRILPELVENYWLRSCLQLTQSEMLKIYWTPDIIRADDPQWLGWDYSQLQFLTSKSVQYDSFKLIPSSEILSGLPTKWRLRNRFRFVFSSNVPFPVFNGTSLASVCLFFRTEATSLHYTGCFDQGPVWISPYQSQMNRKKK
jgi:hypothetical protein